MKTLMCLVLMAACSMAGTTMGGGRRTINGTKVIPGPSYPASELITVSNLRFFACSLEETTAPCTVITGTLTSHIPTSDTAVEVDITLFDVSERDGGRLWPASFKTVVNRPVKNVPVNFVSGLLT